ncbi:MAG: efflux RND transporter periplasmic adaptor subunit [Cyanobacteria bacterium J06635_15]
MSSSDFQAASAPDATSVAFSASAARHRSSPPWQRLLWALFGVFVLLGGGFILWRLFGPKGPPPGPPMGQGVPVQLRQVQTGTIEDSDEYLGALEAQTGVALQPEVSGRVTQVFVSSGDRVTAGTPIVQINPDRTQAEFSAAQANVNVSRAARDSSAANLRSLEAREAELIAEVALQEEEYRRTAALVEAGALADQELDIAVRDREAARASLQSAQQEIEAARASLNQSNASLAQAEANANATRQDLQERTVTAPIDGIVGDIPVKLGDYVETSTLITTIVQNEVLELEIDVPIEQADQLQPGLPVELIRSDTDEALATGSITFISPQTDADTQMVLTKARFTNLAGRLQDAQRVEARIIWERRPGILVPTSAITRLGGQTFVYTVEEADESASEEAGNGAPPPGGGDPAAGPMQVAKLRPVQLGQIQDNEYPVLEGLSLGETIVISGILNLQDGTPVVPQSDEAEAPQSAP